ncbi:hypothetical protein [Staphylococcus hominis]|jgi:hypothetical protein|uniref:hypothetical protein n=1 Tax=Staphylococcus hominis TaxID=1290 RepID=UPI0020B14280|nr:hypothetical protein [Staphylococcus hominis]
MENYRQMWMSLRNDLSMRIREYRQADNIAGLDDYGLTELDAWEGIMQEIEGLERQLEENDRAKENVLEFAKKNGLDIDESYPRSDWWKFRDERDAYKKQRDELTDDMAEVKRKAEAWDKLKEEKMNDYKRYSKKLEEAWGFDYITRPIENYLGEMEIILKRMDELDGTHEFQNLLSDLEEQ